VTNFLKSSKFRGREPIKLINCLSVSIPSRRSQLRLIVWFFFLSSSLVLSLALRERGSELQALALLANRMALVMKPYVYVSSYLFDEATVVFSSNGEEKIIPNEAIFEFQKPSAVSRFRYLMLTRFHMLPAKDAQFFLASLCRDANMSSLVHTSGRLKISNVVNGKKYEAEHWCY